jgi:hypothetical protein
MIVGGILFGLAALTILSGAVCWLAGVPMVSLVKVGIGAVVVLLLGAGGVVVTAEVLTSAGYFDSGRVDPGKQSEITLPAPDGSWPLETMSEEERLKSLHHTTVRLFIDQRDFGKFRGTHVPIYIGDVVNDKTYYRDERPLEEDRWPAKDSKNVHYSLSGTLGFLSFPTNANKEQWKVRQLQLIGLVMQKEPVVYLTDQVPKMTDVKEVPTRELDAFESAALDAIRGGESLKIEKHDNQLRMVGPIYAGQRCVKCHEEKGKLLGAFTYRLERVTAEKRDLP